MPRNVYVWDENFTRTRLVRGRIGHLEMNVIQVFAFLGVGMVGAKKYIQIGIVNSYSNTTQTISESDIV